MIVTNAEPAHAAGTRQAAVDATHHVRAVRALATAAIDRS
jgi:hypothetical protein